MANTDTDVVEVEPTPIEDLEDHGVLSLSVLSELITTGRISETTKEAVRLALEDFHGSNPRVDPAASVPDGSASVVLDWVDEDPDRAVQALDAEAERDRPRSTLTKQLQAIAYPTDSEV